MGCDGTRIFVLGGILSPGVQADETRLIHVLDTRMYFPFVISLGQPLSLKTQSTLSRNPTPLSILVRRPLNSWGSRQRVPRPEDNHISRHLLCQMPMQHIMLLLFKKPPQESWITPRPSRLLASKTPVWMVYHRDPRV
jgi:hypothetical protein